MNLSPVCPLKVTKPSSYGIAVPPPISKDRIVRFPTSKGERGYFGRFAPPSSNTERSGSNRSYYDASIAKLSDAKYLALSRRIEETNIRLDQQRFQQCELLQEIKLLREELKKEKRFSLSKVLRL